MQKAAIVILNYNGEEMLQKFLPEVVEKSKYEIIVADNGSTDHSVFFVKENYPYLTCLLLGSNFGYSQGYNLALSQLEGKFEYYILLNSDVQVTENWDKDMIEWLDQYPQVAASQPKILSYLNPSHFDHAGAGGGFLDALGYPYCRGRIFNETERDQHQFDDQLEVEWASGACFFVRAIDFHSAGGFDKQFFAHMEEIDLCWRLRLSGKQIFYNGEISVFHINGGTLPKRSPYKTFLNFRNSLLMLYKNLPSTKFLQIFLFRVCLDFVAILHFCLTEGLIHGHAVWRAYRDFFKLRTSVEKTFPLALKLTREVHSKKVFSIVFTYYLRGKRRYQDI